MKKIILLPKTDTITLCLPEKWVGIPIICNLTPLYDYPVNNNELEMETEMERVAVFLNKKRKRRNKYDL
jgi:hypothetical protein